MKHVLPGIALIAILLAGCKKDNSTPSGGNGGGTPPAGGGTKSSITITSVSPQNPHTDNIITITGTGFNPDKTKDVVYFGNYDSVKKEFRGYVDGQGKDNISTITSASSTTLVIQAFNPQGLSFDFFSQGYVFHPAVPAIQVIANGDTAYKIVVFKEFVKITTIYDPQELTQVVPTGWPGDSLLITCEGPIDIHQTLSIDGNICPIILVDQQASNYGHTSTLHTFVPKTLFGSSNIDTTTKIATVKVKLDDGTEEQSNFNFFISPAMKVTSLKPASSSYSATALQTSGATVNITVTGRNLKNDTKVTVYYVENGVGKIVGTSSLGVSGFPDTNTIELFAGGYPISRTYTVTLSRTNLYTGNDINYGSCSFFLNP